ncbi:type II toxin-antitoxin system Phd/YefM family antitoxin [Mycobacterium riyadhense]|uniref:type II toxin-antitoxin system Phd/YefM family antitoxin n=1 Tax=Mycobacterium riyadhense TaxID=486698 RepID=UPI00195745B8|nr:type II toxin-antitoxin system Phd/YefM family antitoxin [Mycobacterium riyadhense]
MSISASDARQRLFPLLKQVNTDHEPVRITSKAGDAVLMSADDYDAWQETVYLLRSPENARRLMQAVARDKARPAVSDRDTTKTIEELREMAGGQG